MSIYFELQFGNLRGKEKTMAWFKLSFLNLIDCIQMSLSKAMMWYDTFFDKMVENMNNILWTKF